MGGEAEVCRRTARVILLEGEALDRNDFHENHSGRYEVGLDDQGAFLVRQKAVSSVPTATPISVEDNDDATAAAAPAPAPSSPSATTTNGGKTPILDNFLPNIAAALAT